MFSKKAVEILNQPFIVLSDHKQLDASSSADPAYLLEAETPVLVTVSSRLRRDSSQETEGFDEHWDLGLDRKQQGHMIIRLKDLSKIETISVPASSRPLELENIKKARATSARESGEEMRDYLDSPMKNCYSIFPDVLQKPGFAPPVLLTAQNLEAASSAAEYK